VVSVDPVEVIEGDLSAEDLALVRRYIWSTVQRSSIIRTSTPTAPNSSARSNRWLELLLPRVCLALGDRLTDRARPDGDALRAGGIQI
jgi:hypothetical protein